MWSKMEMDVSWDNLFWLLLWGLNSFTQSWDHRHVFALLDKVVGGDLSRSGHSTYDGVISLLLDCFLHLFHTSLSSVTVRHCLALKLNSFTGGHSDCRWNMVLCCVVFDFIGIRAPRAHSCSASRVDKATAGDKSTWLLCCQHFIVYQQVQVQVQVQIQVKVHLILPTFYLISACPVSKFAGMWASRNAKGKWDWQRRVWCPMRIRIL